MDYIPKRGDLVWINFNPQVGHEQAGRRPAIVLTNLAYNRLIGLALLCPVTSKIKGYPFEVALPDGLPVNGVILADQVKSLAWKARNTLYITDAPEQVIIDVLEKINTLVK